MWHMHPLRVHYKETDQMGVVHHANYVSWFEIGRTEMMRHLGIAYRDMEDLGLLLPVLDVNVKYHQPARYDHCVLIYTSLAEFSRVRMKFKYEIRLAKDEYCMVQQVADPLVRGNDRQGELLSSGHTLHMWLNSDWKPARLDQAAPDVYERVKGLYERDS